MSLRGKSAAATTGFRTPELLVPAVLGGLLLLYFVVPFVAFLARTGSVSIVEPLTGAAGRTAIRNSLLTAPIATAIATVLGVPLAYLLARRSFRGKRIVEAFVVLPLIVPPVVGGAMLLTVVGRFTPIGAAAAGLGIPLTDSLVGVILAQTFVAAPFVVITAR
ncbi:MAG: sulfate ABC transporter permease, partial [Natronomonas sp.]